jgi:hypothetical protein
LLDHFVLKSGDNLLQILSQDDFLLQPVAVLIVELFHLVVDVESQVDMVSEHVFAFRDVHAAKLGNVFFKFIYRLRGILLFYYVLNLAAFLAEDSFKGVEMLISHLLENLIFIVQLESHHWGDWGFGVF